MAIMHYTVSLVRARLLLLYVDSDGDNDGNYIQFSLDENRILLLYAGGDGDNGGDYIQFSLSKNRLISI
jgi:hypothetical protein